MQVCEVQGHLKLFPDGEVSTALRSGDQLCTEQVHVQIGFVAEGSTISTTPLTLKVEPASGSSSS